MRQSKDPCQNFNGGLSAARELYYYRLYSRWSPERYTRGTKVRPTTSQNITNDAALAGYDMIWRLFTPFIASSS